MTQGSIIARIISEYSPKGTKAAQKDLNRLNKKFDDMGRKSVKAANIAIGAFAALSVKVGKDAVRAAIDDNKSQALLAGTIRTVTGASADQVKAVEAQIAALSSATGVLDDDLRPSLQQFLMLTKDIEKAQFLQGIAVELAAKEQIDLASATDIISKAYRGQFRGLQNLGIALDDNIIKNKDVAGALEATIEATKGASEAANDADPFIKLNKDIQDLYETLGLALLPVMVEFVSFLRDQLIPEITRWVTTNREQLINSLETVSEKVFGLVEAGVKLDDFLRKFNLTLVDVISEIIKFVAVLNLLVAGRTLLALITDTAKFSGAVAVLNKATASGKVLEFFTKLGTSSAVLGTNTGVMATRIATLGAGMKTFAAGTGLAAGAVKLLLKVFNAFFKLSPLGKIILLVYGFQALAKGVSFLKNKFFGTDEIIKKKVVLPMQNANQATIDYFNTWTKNTIKQKKDQETLAQIAKDKAAQAKRDAIDERTRAIKAAIAKKFNVKLTDPDQKDEIDAKAIQLNLIRSKKIAEAELAKQSRILEALNKAALEEEIKLRERIRDILDAYRDDQKVDAVEIAGLAKLWGTTADAAALYVEQIVAVSDKKISEDEVTNLSIQWGISKEQAAKYLDFYKMISDGKISDAEIKNLATKWNMTVGEAQKYADFIIAVQDRDLNDAEVQRLKDKWGLTNEELTSYILGIGAPVKYTGSILDPDSIKKLEDAWTAALAALIKYKNALGQGGFTAIIPGAPAVTSPKPGDPVVIPKAGDPAVTAAASASKAAAAAYAAAKAAGDMNAAAIAAAGVNPSALAANESGAIGAASIAEQLRAAEAALQVQKNATTLANFKAKEAEDAAASKAVSAQLDYDERSKFRSMSLANASSTVDNAKGLMGSGMSNSSPTINLTVNGTVTSEQDLISTVRQGLLRGQTNGQTLTLATI